MAAELRITPEWLSKIMNGHISPSYNIGLRFDDFLRQRKLDPTTFGRDSEDSWQIHLSQDGEAATVREELDRHYRDLVVSAGDDTSRLNWILGQLRTLRIRPALQGPYRQAKDLTSGDSRKAEPRGNSESDETSCDADTRPTLTASPKAQLGRKLDSDKLSREVGTQATSTTRPKAEPHRQLAPDKTSRDMSEGSTSRGDLIKARYRLLTSP